MAKNFLLVSDPHFSSSNVRCRAENMLEVSQRKVIQIMALSEKYTAPVLIAGDLTHTPRDFETLSMLLWQKFQGYAVKGQHDSYYRSRKPAVVDILSMFGNIRILSQGILPHTLQAGKKRKRVNICGASWKENIPEIYNKEHFNILVCHAPISYKSGHGIKYNALSFLRLYKDFDLILCGDIHAPFIMPEKKMTGKTRYIVNTGPIVRRSLDEMDLEPHVLLMSLNEKFEIQLKEIPLKTTSVTIFEERERKKAVKELAALFASTVRRSKISDAIDVEQKLEKIINSSKLNNTVLHAIEEIRKDVDDGH